VCWAPCERLASYLSAQNSCQDLLLGQRGRQLANELADLGDEIWQPLTDQGVTRGSPSLLHLRSCFDQLLYTAFNANAPTEKLKRHRFASCADIRGLPPLSGPKVSIRLRRLAQSQCCTLSRVGGDPQFSQMTGELVPPSSQHRLGDTRLHPLFAQRLHDLVHVRMGLVSAEHEYIRVLEPKLLANTVLRHY
jgi:hypothetical protein